MWEILGILLKGEREDPILSEKFYWEVVQAVLLFGSKTWVMSGEILKNIEGVHMGFL